MKLLKSIIITSALLIFLVGQASALDLKGFIADQLKDSSSEKAKEVKEPAKVVEPKEAEAPKEASAPKEDSDGILSQLSSFKFEIALGGIYQNPSIGLTVNKDQFINKQMEHAGIHRNFRGQASMHSQINVHSALDPAFLFMGHINVEHPIPFVPNVGLMYSPVSLEGYAVIDATVSLFADRRRSNYSKTVEMFFYNTIHMFDLSLYYGTPFLVTATSGWLNIDIGLNLKLLSVPDAFKVIDKDLPVSILPVPALYLAFQIAPVANKFSIEGEFRMLPSFVIAAMTDEFGAYSYDALFRLKYKIYDPAFVSVGYRYQDLGGGVNGLYMSLIAQGAFAEVGAGF